MGGSKGGGTTTQQSTTTIPPEVLQQYQNVNALANQAASQPFTPYSGEFVAPVNSTQQGGVDTISNAAGVATPYYGAASTALNTGLAAAQPYYGAATEQVASGLAGGTAGNTAATSALNTGLAGSTPYNAAAAANYSTAYNSAQPYNAGATGLALAGTQAVDPSALSIGQYMSPYTQSVINSTMGLVNQQQAQQRNALTSNAILSGSYGGDRSGVAQGVLGGQQDLATANIVSGLYNQNYSQALGAAQQQQGVGLAAGQANRAALQTGATTLAGIGNQTYTQGMGLGSANAALGNQVYNQGLGASNQALNIGNAAYTQGLGAANANLGIGQSQFNMGNTAAGTEAALGTGLQNADLTQGQAQLAAGTVGQQTQQAQDTAVYNQFLQQQGYPFQVDQFLANIAEGTGALSGSTTTGSTTAPQPFFSDERLKENISTIGHTKDGLKIIRFNYKGSPHTQIGLSAQDVEKKRPEAVGLAGGYKTVDYDRATRALGGAVANDNAGAGFASGGLAYDPSTLSALLVAHQAMYPGAGAGGGASGVNIAGGPYGAAGTSGAAPKSLQSPALMKLPAAQPTGLRQTAADVSSGANMLTTGKALYGAGRDALVGEAANGKTPASGGLLGTGGKWDPSQGWISKQTGAGTVASATSTPMAGSVTSTPLPLIDATANATGDVAATAPADASLVDDAIGLVARRGGRIKRAAGGGMPYGNFSILPEDDYAPIDPNKLKSEQAGLVNKLPSESSGSTGGSGGSGLGGTIGSLGGGALGSFGGPLGMMVGSGLGGALGRMFNKGGRAKFDDGGAAVDMLPPDGLPPFDNVVPDNVIPFKPREGLAGAERRSDEAVRPTLDADATRERDEEARGRNGLAVAPAVATGADVTAARAGATSPRDTPAVVTPAASSGLAPPQLPSSTAVASDEYNAPASVASRHWIQESGDRQFRPDGTPILSRTGAAGRSQLQAAGPEAAKLAGLPWDPERAKTDEKYNRTLGDTWLTHLNQQYGDPYKAAAAYNAGVGATDRAIQQAQTRGGNYWDYLPAETQNHLYAISGGQYGRQAATATASRTGSLVNAAGAVDPQQGLAGAALPPASADITLPPKDLQKGDFLDRNERPIVAGLTFLGNMLGSKSHQLTGSIGEGLAAAAPAYAQMGFKQQEAGLQQQGQNIQSRSLDIQQRAQYMTLLTQLRTMQNARSSRGLPPDPQLEGQISHLAGLVAAPGNGPNGGAAAQPGLPPGPLAGNPAPAPAASAAPPAGPVAPAGAPGAPMPLAPAAAPQAPTIDPGLASRHPTLTDMPAQVAQPAFLSRIAPEENPFELYRRADQIADDGDPNGMHAKAVARADQAARNLKELGYAMDKDGNPVLVPGMPQTARAKQMIDANNGWTQKEAAANNGRQDTRQSLDIVRKALEEYQTNALGEFSGDVQRYLKAAGIPVGNTPATNASAVQELIKQTAAQAGAAGDTDMARSLSRMASIDPNKEPEANKQILAQSYAKLNADDAKFKYLQPRISAAPQLDTPHEEQKWTEANPRSRYYDEAYKGLAVAGATPAPAEMKSDHTYIIAPAEAEKYGFARGAFDTPRKFKVVERDGRRGLVPVP